MMSVPTITDIFKNFTEDEMVARIGAAMERNGAVKVGTSQPAQGSWQQSRNSLDLRSASRWEGGVKVADLSDHRAGVN